MGEKGFIPTVNTVCDISMFRDNAKYMEQKERSAVKLEISHFFIFFSQAESRNPIVST